MIRRAFSASTLQNWMHRQPVGDFLPATKRLFIDCRDSALNWRPAKAMPDQFIAPGSSWLIARELSVDTMTRPMPMQSHVFWQIHTISCKSSQQQGTAPKDF